MSAATRLAALDTLPAQDLCARAEVSLTALVEIMNEETTLLRAGHMRQAGALTPQKTALAQDYVGFARSVQRQIDRLRAEAPEALERLQNGHERLATQMAENLRVIATARSVIHDIMSDVAERVGKNSRTRTYDASGELAMQRSSAAQGISVNRAL